MKTMKFFVAMTIALAAVLVTSCGKKNEPKLPEGTPIGEGLFLVEQTAKDGTKTVLLQDSTCATVGGDYTAIADSGSYLAARKADGAFELLNKRGGTFAHASSFEVKTYYATTTATPTGKIIKTMIAANNNHLAFDLASHQRLITVEGIKDNVLPLDNGYTLYQIQGLWGVAKPDADTPLADGAKEIVVITNKDGKTCYWINTKDGAGLINEKGEVIKRISPVQMKAIKKKAEKLWDEGAASAIVVKNI